jgi:hypothetical protein
MIGQELHPCGISADLREDWEERARKPKRRRDLELGRGRVGRKRERKGAGR